MLLMNIGGARRIAQVPLVYTAGMMNPDNTWTNGTNTWGTTDYAQSYYIEYTTTSSDRVDIEEEQFVGWQYVEEWFAPTSKPVREFRSQCHGKRWFEHCRKRNGRDRIAQTIMN